MLPFLKQRKQTGLIISERKSDGKVEAQHEEGDENQALEAVADDIQRAISMKDSRALAAAIRAAFEICDAMPHVEGSHLDETE